MNAAITGHTWESALDMVGVAREFDAFALNFQHFWFLTRPMVEAHNARWGGCFPLEYERVGGTATRRTRSSARKGGLIDRLEDRWRQRPEGHR